MILNRNTKNKQKSPKNDSYLAIDIGTEFIKTVVFINEGRQVEVIGYNRTKQRSSSMYAAFIIDINEVTDALDRSIGEAIAMAQKYFEEEYNVPKEAIIGIAGELVQGMTILVNVDRENPESAIDQSEIEETISKVKKFTFESTKEDISKELMIPVKQLVEIDTYINSVSIDGLRVIEAIGHKGSEIVYRVFSTFAPRVHVDSLNQIVSNLGLKVKKIVVEPYAIALALDDMRSSNTSGIIIDIGGGTTDVALVQNGDIIGTKMFAIGGRVFTKRIEKEFGVNYEDAENMKMDYVNNKLTNTDTSKIRKFFNDDVKLWLSGVEISLEQFEDVKEYPTNIYLCGGGALLPEIQEGLISHPWLQTLNFKKFPKVNFIFPNSVVDVLDKTKTATQPIDVAPLSLARMILEN